MLLVALAAVCSGLPWTAAARAERIENPVAVFAALDKVTARISKLEVPLNQTVRFGALNVTPRVCYSRPPTETPKTTAFVEINERQLDGSATKLFTGWMFAESPGLNAVEHPVFDIWLTGCVDPRRSAAVIRKPQEGDGQQVEIIEDAPPSRSPRRRRRVRR